MKWLHSLKSALLAGSVLFATGFSEGLAQNTNAVAVSDVRIVELQGMVEISPQGATTWQHAQANQTLHPFDRVRLAENSRVALHWSGESIVSFGASTELEILPPNAVEDQPGLHLVRGIMSFFHRDQPGRIRVITRGAVAGVEGTEFALAVADAGVSTLSVIDGKVRFGNEQATLLLTNGEQAVAAPGKAPMRTAGFIANNLLQWCFYYPAVLDPDELPLTDAGQPSLADSLAAYRSGDLLAALKQYPAAPDTSDARKVYHAAVLLAVGDVAEAETILAGISAPSGRPAMLGMALRQLIVAVKRQPSVLAGEPKLASALLADSYFQQSRAVRETSLENALKLARQATVVSPQFGFAWERVAELEFSFGHQRAALKALNQSLALAPNNAQAMALKGFILAAGYEPRAAREWFNRAIAADPALGNAWLGRGLVRIHLGDAAGGREDLLVAAALEPQRAELRSYLGKTYTDAGDDAHAARELMLAKKLDPNDPTAWLYSALANQRNNCINDAIRDLEESQALNDNRSVYRSELLLDQDSAVRSANLAWMYQDAGMADWAQREAGRAVSMDYADYSAHLFLANSYSQLRDPNWANLRYESADNLEFSVANLLAPASAGILTTITGEQPSAKLFDKNRVGVVSDTTYLERGAWMENGAQFGTFDNFSYDVEAGYITDPGQRQNEYLDHRRLEVNLKYQITPQDSVYFGAQQVKIEWGNPTSSADTSIYPQSGFESQQPNFYAGYHHEWGPGVHTLLMASSVKGDSSVTAADVMHWSAHLNWDGTYGGIPAMFDQTYADISGKQYTVDLQQIWETPNHTTVAGAHYGDGEILFRNIEWNPTELPYDADSITFLGILGYNPDPINHPFEIANQTINDYFYDANVYLYHDWQICDPLKLFAGVNYDHLEMPAVVNTVPFSSQQRSTSQLSPKGGFIWTPLADTVLRFAYTRSLSGFNDDSSIRLEPTQVAGFNQAYRSIIPDSAAGGDTSGSQLDTLDAALEQKFNTGTYLSLSGEILYSKLLRYEGAYVIGMADDWPYSMPLRDQMDYCEKSLQFSADQLLGKQWSVGGLYRISEANLKLDYVDVPADLPPVTASAPFMPRQNMESVLQKVALHANWNHPSGLFSMFEADWYRQDNFDYSPAQPGDNFWQLNASAGCRFWHRQAEVSVGVLNLTDQDYRLMPLNFYNEMARRRTFFVRLLVAF